MRKSERNVSATRRRACSPGTCRISSRTRRLVMRSNSGRNSSAASGLKNAHCDDLALRDRQRRVEEPERNARQPRHAAGDLEQVRQPWRRRKSDSSGVSCVIVPRTRRERALSSGSDRLEVALEDERALALAQERAAERDHAVACRRARATSASRKSCATIGGATRRARVVARVREAREPLEEHLELEERLLAAALGEPRDPLVARLRLLAPQAARVAQELGVGVAPARRDRPGATRAC